MKRQHAIGGESIPACDFDGAWDMAETPTVIGNYLSPYVRKVLVCLELKGIP